jgi:cytochrome c-type biogenesis protein
VSEPTLALALAAGLASFLSPCMLPVIPAFLAQLAGTSLDVSNLKRRDVLSGTVLFVAGFSAVFALLGVVLGTVLQEAATEVLAWLSRLAGTVVIVLGLHLTGLLRLPFLDREYWALPGAPTAGHLAPFVFGASFAVAWTPCVGLLPSHAFAFLKRHRKAAARLHVAFGAILIGMGVLVFTNKLSLLANFQLLNEVLL